MMARSTVFLFLAASTLWGCSRSEAPAPGAAPSGAASGAAAPNAAPGAAASAKTAAAKPAKTVYKAELELEAGEIYVPGKGDVPNAKEWENVKWRGDDAGTELGKASLEVVIDEATGLVSGGLTGASGEATLAGRVLGDQVNGTFARKDPGDMGLTGSLVATRKDDGLDGTVRLSIATARVIRRGSFHATKAP